MILLKNVAKINYYFGYKSILISKTKTLDFIMYFSLEMFPSNFDITGSECLRINVVMITVNFIIPSSINNYDCDVNNIFE